jgi:pimeloyl-ACP methyl ester carboxylesterase
LRNGEIGGRTFDEVLYVGHSYGSLIGNVHSKTYPSDIDAYVFTGYTDKIKASLTTVVTTGGFAPAAVVLPNRFGGLAVSYVAASSGTGTYKLFFTNNSDPALRDLNYVTRGTATLGEYVSGFFSEDIARAYTGPVYVLTGENDSIFCSPDALGLGTATGHGECGTGPSSIVGQTQSQYPNVVDFEYDIPAGIGHCNILHYGAQEQFKAVHDWLSGQGY